MVIKNKKLNILGFAASLALLLALVLFSFSVENNTCMGVEMVSAVEYESMLSQSTNAFDVEFLFNKEVAPVDKTHNVIYISQNITEETARTDLYGVLSAKNPNYQLVVKKDENTNNLLDTMTQGRRCSLLAIAPSGESVEYQIIFTSLPVITIDGSITGIANNGTDLFSGELSFFDPVSEETKSYRTESCAVQWHIRGNTTAKQPKKPWKLSLKDNNDENKDLSFCGLSEDDDWILNPMNLDDLKLREKMMMDLWNQNQLFTDHGLYMSRCEYVEVVINGEYQGLYLLQRRLDKKYLNISDEDILLKSRNMPQQPVVTGKTMEIIYSPFPESETFDWLEKYFDGKYISNTNIENWIHLNSYIQMACSVDNRQSKNIVMLLNRDDKNDYIVNYILWDTDMSFGLQWSNGYVYDYDRTVFDHTVVRFELDKLSEIYPSLDKDMALHWAKLRKGPLSDENIYNTIEKLYTDIIHSQSLQRDYNKWGSFYKGADNMDQLYIFMKNRLEYLDNYYSAS